MKNPVARSRCDGVRETSTLWGAMDKVFSRDGTAITVQRIGAGHPVVLLGGALCDHWATAELAELLAPNFEVFNVSRRGRGESGDTAPYAVEREQEDLEAVIAEAGGRAHVFAHCTGAVLAFDVALRGDGITKLVAYEPPYILEGSRERLDEKYRSDLAEHIRDDRPGDAVKHFMINAVGFKPDSVGRIEQSEAWPHLVGLAHTLPYDGEIIGDCHVPDRISRITVPTLGVTGEKSPQWQQDSLAEVVSRIPGARAVTLPEADHNLVAASVAPSVIEFFGTDD